MSAGSALAHPEQFQTILAGSDEPGWLKSKRKEGLTLYQELPIPHSPARERNVRPLAPGDIENLPGVQAKPEFSCGNSQVVLSPLHEAILGGKENIEPFFGKIVKPGINKWAALNQGLWRQGVYVRIPRNIDAVEPVFIHHSLVESSLLLPRVLVVAEPGTRTVILDHYQSDFPSFAFVSPIIEIIAQENAQVHYVQIQEWGLETHHHTYENITTGRNARVEAVSCMFGGKRAVNHLQVSLQGEGSHANLFGLVFGDQDQVFEHYTLQEHVSPQTQSDLLIKVALKGKAYSHFDGLIWIEKGAIRSSAYQQNRNLLLSDEAKADSTPRLEILENDILGCTHGVAVGPVDEEQLFYLQSRGLARPEAEALVVEGFFEQVLARISVESLRQNLQQKLSLRLRR